MCIYAVAIAVAASQVGVRDFNVQVSGVRTVFDGAVEMCL